MLNLSLVTRQPKQFIINHKNIIEETRKKHILKGSRQINSIQNKKIKETQKASEKCSERLWISIIENTVK